MNKRDVAAVFVHDCGLGGVVVDDAEVARFNDDSLAAANNTIVVVVAKFVVHERDFFIVAVEFKLIGFAGRAVADVNDGHWRIM